MIDAINRELAPIRARAQTYVDDPALAKNIVADGCDKARKLAQETMRDAREAWGSPTRERRQGLRRAGHRPAARSLHPARRAGDRAGGLRRPLDLLLYLIRKENLDIMDIQMAPLTRQYMDYVEAMRTPTWSSPPSTW